MAAALRLLEVAVERIEVDCSWQHHLYSLLGGVSSGQGCEAVGRSQECAPSAGLSSADPRLRNAVEMEGPSVLFCSVPIARFSIWGIAYGCSGQSVSNHVGLVRT